MTYSAIVKSTVRENTPDPVYLLQHKPMKKIILSYVYVEVDEAIM